MVSIRHETSENYCEFSKVLIAWLTIFPDCVVVDMDISQETVLHKVLPGQESAVGRHFVT